MRIKYHISIDDHVAFSQFHHKHSPTVRRTYLIAGVLLPVCLFAYSLLTGWYEGSWRTSIFVFVVAGLMTFWVFGGKRRRLERQVRKLLGEGSNKATVGEHELELSENELVERGEYGESRFSLDVVVRLGFTADYTFIYTSAISGITLPKRAVVEGDYDAFITELKRKIEEKKRVEGIEQRRDWDKAVITDAEKFYREDTSFGKHSGLGIASFMIAMAVVALHLLVFVIIFMLGVVAPDLMGSNSAMVGVLGMCMIAGFFGSLIGLGLGISGVSQKNRKKVFATLGLVFNAVIILSLIALIAIGMVVT
jgi:hypothetical protein